MHTKVLGFLRSKEDYVSGEEIARDLGISRQALWKHIQELRTEGYDIAAVPHLGYKLQSLPDRLFPSEIAHGLHTNCAGRKILYFDSLASTMDTAMELGAKKEQEGTVVLAEAQTKGRGRLSREWVSLKHKGIYFSLLLRPRISPQEAPLLTILAAVSVLEGVRLSVSINAQIKWPNDILCGSKKLGGILTELNAETDEVRFAAIGVGINVNADKKSLPSGATSLKDETGSPVSRIEVLQNILRAFDNNYILFKKKGGPPLIEKWREYNCTLGRRVKIIMPGEHLEAVAVDIDNDGALLVRADSGLIRKITAGDVVHCR